MGVSSPRPSPCALAVRGWGIRPGRKGLAAPVAGRACGQTDASAREIGTAEAVRVVAVKLTATQCFIHEKFALR
jgi:hypothetical protein